MFSSRMKTKSVPTYSIVPSVSSVNEGSAVTFNITTTNVSNGTILYWTLTGVALGSDFTDGLVSGSVTINENIGSITRTLRADATTEGTETFALQLRTDLVTGTIVETSTSVIVNDTSLTSISASGGAVTYSGGYTIHTFNANATFTLNTSATLKVLVLAGGGSGATSYNYGKSSGGGGAGGYIYTDIFLPAGSYPVVVGAGGIAPNNPYYDNHGVKGANSSFNGLIAEGGGGGRTNGAAKVAANGGCGGGTNSYNPSGGTASQGFPGGNYVGGYATAAGGGGIGGPGQDNGYAGGAGGIGLQFQLTGSKWYGGGGGGGRYYGNPVCGGMGANGLGGGPTANGGGGGTGGGCSTLNNPISPQSGGSGVVVIGYLTV